MSKPGRVGWLDYAFGHELSFAKRLILGVALFLAGYGLTSYLYLKTSFYFSSLTLLAVFLITLMCGRVLGLVFTVALTLVADYYFVPPIGSVLDSLISTEHFVIVVSIGVLLTLVTSALKGYYKKIIVLKQIAEEKKTEAEEAAHSMEKVLALVSHDIRNPISAATLSAELLLRNASDPEASKKVSQRIINTLTRADQMIQTLLDVSRIREGKTIPLTFDFCDLTSVIQIAVEDFTLTFGNRFTFATGEPIFGKWSEGGIRRALENLVTNAMKYGLPESPIDILLKRETDSIKILIHNQGKPIALDDQLSLFDAFKRTDSAERGKEIGWGLGLALVKGVAEAHHGTATVESTEGAGTTFTLCLPIC
jgi:signal transduction histidine kinase